jgi:RNA polymerase subunit RPABC4/transcription elongation factor Spt4
MSVGTESSACSLCGGSVGAGDKECAHCHATSQWQDYARAIDFARKEFAGLARARPHR